MSFFSLKKKSEPEDSKSKKEVQFQSWKPGDDEDKTIYYSKASSSSSAPLDPEPPKATAKKQKQPAPTSPNVIIVVSHTPPRERINRGDWHPPLRQERYTEAGPRPAYFSSGLGLAVVSCLFCPLIGCFIIYKAMIARRLFENGYVNAALEASRETKMLAIAVIILGLIMWVLSGYYGFRRNRRVDVYRLHRKDHDSSKTSENETSTHYSDVFDDAAHVAGPEQSLTTILIMATFVNILTHILG